MIQIRINLSGERDFWRNSLTLARLHAVAPLWRACAAVPGLRTDATHQRKCSSGPGIISFNLKIPEN